MEILEARVEYVNGQIDRVTVLADFTPEFLKDDEPMCDVRAVFASRKHMHGYLFFNGAVTLNAELLKNVVELGVQTVDRDQIFPDWKAKHTLKKKMHPVSNLSKIVAGISNLLEATKSPDEKWFLPTEGLPEFDIPVIALIKYEGDEHPSEHLVKRINDMSLKGWHWRNEQFGSFINGEVLRWKFRETKNKSND